MNPELISYTIAISGATYVMDWVIIRGPQYLVSFSELTLTGEAEYVLGIF